MALKYISSALELSIKNSYSTGVMRSLNIAGTLYMRLGNYKNAIDCFRYNLYLGNNLRNLKFISWSYSNLGEIFRIQSQLDKAIEYHKKSLLIDIYRNSSKDLAISYNSIGILYNEKNKNDSALLFYKKALHYYEKCSDSDGIAISCSNIGQLYTNLNDYPNAYKYLNRSLRIRLKINDSVGLAHTFQNFAEYYFHKNDAAQSLKYLQIAENYTKNDFYSDINQEIQLQLNKLYLAKKDYKNTYLSNRNYSLIKDSLLKYENLLHIEKMDWEYKLFDYKKNIEIQNALKDQQNKAKLDKQKLIKNIFITAFAFLLIISTIITKLYNDKKKSNLQLTLKKTELELQKNQITQQKSIIENKNKNIIESLNYAKRIQQTLLPSNKNRINIFPESFIIFIPKSIVSGDFYWIEEKDDYKYFATVDCTGHGVPGALLTIFAYQLLNESINYLNITDPAKILTYISKEINKAFQRKNEENNLNDGMDIALISIQNSSLQLSYAGVGLSLYICHNNSFTDLKPDIMPIGKIDCDENKIYTTKYIKLNKNDKIYTFTDGFADQIGGENNRKYMRKNFKQLLFNNCHLPLAMQKQIIENEYLKWKNSNDQVDDILVAGIKLI